MTKEGARDPLPVGVIPGDSGGRSSFDGNHTDDLLAWFVCGKEGWASVPEEFKAMLRDQTFRRGHLAWFMFPTQRG